MERKNLVEFDILGLAGFSGLACTDSRHKYDQSLILTIVSNYAIHRSLTPILTEST